MRSNKRKQLLVLVLLCFSICNAFVASAASVSFSLPVSIELEGDLPVREEQFQVKLVPEDPDYPMPEDGKDVITIHGDAMDSFADICYSHPGIYYYKIYQIKGASDCKYDQREYQLTVTVLNSSTGEELEISAALYENSGVGKIQDPVFYNEYPVEAESEVISEVTSDSTDSVKTGVEDYRAFYLLMMSLSFIAICKTFLNLKRRKE